MEENPQPLKANFQKEKKQIVIFGNSIPRGIRLHEFYWLHKGYAQLKSFPGGTSKELCYVEPKLKSKKFDATLLHVGVNDLLNDESQDFVQNLLDNLKQIGLKCKSARGTRILISGIAVKNKLTSVNQRIPNMCLETTHLFLLTTIIFLHQVSFTMVYTYLKSENVF